VEVYINLISLVEAKEKLPCKSVKFAPFSALLWTSVTCVITNDEADYSTHAHFLSKTVSVLSVDAGCQHTHSPDCICSAPLPCGLFPLSVVGSHQQKPLGYVFPAVAVPSAQMYSSGQQLNMTYHKDPHFRPFKCNTTGRFDITAVDYLCISKEQRDTGDASVL